MLTITQIANGRWAAQFNGITVRTFPTREAAQAYIDSVEQ